MLLSIPAGLGHPRESPFTERLSPYRMHLAGFLTDAVPFFLLGSRRTRAWGLSPGLTPNPGSATNSLLFLI
jgi:hypothetical protein